MTTVVSHLQSCIHLFKYYHDTGFSHASAIAKDISEELGINPKLQEVLKWKKKWQFEYETFDEV